jgi:hypothetical protein
MLTLTSLGLLGGVLSFMGYVPYARAIIRGETRPERLHWLVWSLSNLLVLLSYFVLGARTTIWVPIAYTLGSLLITGLSFVYGGRSGWGLFEKSKLVVALISAIRWVFFDNVFFALIATLAVGFLGYIPNMWRLAKDSMEKEDPAEWGLFLLGGVLNLAAVSEWTYQIATLPVLIVIMNGIMFALALRNTIWQSRHAVDENSDSDTER